MASFTTRTGLAFVTLLKQIIKLVSKVLNYEPFYTFGWSFLHSKFSCDSSIALLNSNLKACLKLRAPVLQGAGLVKAC